MKKNLIILWFHLTVTSVTVSIATMVGYLSCKMLVMYFFQRRVKKAGMQMVYKFARWQEFPGRPKLKGSEATA